MNYAPISLNFKTFPCSQNGKTGSTNCCLYYCKLKSPSFLISKTLLQLCCIQIAEYYTLNKLLILLLTQRYACFFQSNKKGYNVILYIFACLVVPSINLSVYVHLWLYIYLAKSLEQVNRRPKCNQEACAQMEIYLTFKIHSEEFQFWPFCCLV